MNDAVIGMSGPRRGATVERVLFWDDEPDWDHQFALAVLYGDDSDPDFPLCETLDESARL